MRSTSRDYFDYNASAPLSPSVREWLDKGAEFFANPASVHYSGKQSKKLINQTRDFFLGISGLSHYEIVFHSGATEGINAFFKGLAFQWKDEEKEGDFFFFQTDHSCVVNQEHHLQLLGHRVHFLPVSESGEFDRDKIIREISKRARGPKAINFTWVNNETGVVWDLQDALEIKNKTNAIVHVDGAQAVGKIKPYRELLALDAYTFSGHKFGALKGVGFSYYSPELILSALIRGGGQQQGHRSGTENVMGVHSLQLAFNDLPNSISELEKARDWLENALLDNFSKRITVAGKKAKVRSANTIYVVIDDIKIDTLLTALDLEGMDVSSGSACSSGAIVPSRVLMAMGYDRCRAKNAVRFSFSLEFNQQKAEAAFNKIRPIFERFLN